MMSVRINRIQRVLLSRCADLSTVDESSGGEKVTGRDLRAAKTLSQMGLVTITRRSPDKSAAWCVATTRGRDAILTERELEPGDSE